MIYSRLLITSGWVSPREKLVSPVSYKSLPQPCKYNTGQKGVLSPACNYPPGNQHARRCWWCFQLIIFYYSWFSVSYNLWYFTIAPSTSSAIMSHCINNAWRHGPTLPYGSPREMQLVQPGRPQPDGFSRLSKLMLALEGRRNLEYLAAERRNREEPSSSDWGYVWEFPLGAWQCIPA